MGGGVSSAGAHPGPIPTVPAKYCVRLPAASKQIAIAFALLGPPLTENPVNRPKESY